jgi:hypothetical protein
MTPIFQQISRKIFNGAKAPSLSEALPPPDWKRQRFLYYWPNVKLKKAKKTVLIYLQIDGQPVNPVHNGIRKVPGFLP